MEFSGPVMTKREWLCSSKYSCCVQTQLCTLIPIPLMQHPSGSGCIAGHAVRELQPPPCAPPQMYTGTEGSMGSNMFHHKDCSKGRIPYILLIGHPVGSM